MLVDLERLTRPDVQILPFGTGGGKGTLESRITNRDPDTERVVQVVADGHAEVTSTRFEVIPPSGVLEFQIKLPSRPWSVTITWLDGSELRHLVKVKGPPLEFLASVGQMAPDASPSWSAIPDDLRTIRDWLRLARSYLPRVNRYALCYHLANSARPYGNHFRNSLLGFVKNHALEVAKDSSAESWPQFRAVLDHYSDWVEDHVSTEAQKYALRALASDESKQAPGARTRITYELLLRVSHALGRRERLSYWCLLYPNLDSDETRRAGSDWIDKTTLEVVGEKEPWCPGSFWESQEGKGTDRVLLNLVLFLLGGKPSQLDLCQAITTFLAASGHAAWEPKITACRLYAEGFLALARNDHATARARFVDCVVHLGPTQDKMRTQALIESFVAESLYLKRYLSPEAAADYLEDSYEAFKGASDSWPETSPFWSFLVEKQILIHRLDALDVVQSTQDHVKLTRQLMKLEAQFAGQPHPETKLRHRLGQFYEKIHELDFEGANALSGAIIEDRKALGLSYTQQEAIGLATMAIAAFLDGNEGQFHEIAALAKAPIGPYLDRFDGLGRIPTIVDLVSTSLTVIGGRVAEPEPPWQSWDEGIEHYLSGDPELQGPLQLFIALASRPTSIPPHGQDDAMRLGHELARFTFDQALKIESGPRLGADVIKAAASASTFMAMPRHLRDELEAIELMQLAQPRPTPAMLLRLAGAVDALSDLIVRFEWERLEAARAKLDLGEPRRLSFGDRVACFQALKWSKAHGRIVSSESVTTLVEFRNDEGHGRFGKWSSDQVADLYDFAQKLMGLLVGRCPVRLRSHGSTPLGGSHIEIDWALTPRMLYVKDAELRDGTEILVDRAVVLGLAQGKVRVVSGLRLGLAKTE